MEYTPAHTPEEAKEFRELKEILNTRGCLMGSETRRWNYLFDKLAAKVIPALTELGEVCRLEDCN